MSENNLKDIVDHSFDTYTFSKVGLNVRLARIEASRRLPPAILEVAVILAYYWHQALTITVRHLHGHTLGPR